MPRNPADESSERFRSAPHLDDDSDFRNNGDVKLIQEFFRSPGYIEDMALDYADQWGCSVDQVLLRLEQAIDRLVPKCDRLPTNSD